jgi:4-diphosphocytidyl-2-C-methyl-D-erythritol kinase
VSEDRVGEVVFRAGFAKVNLALAVGRPEGPKGYHPISSWMACVDLRDDLHLLALDPSRASRYAILWHDDAPKRTDIDWPITKDLAVRAQHALEERIGRRLTIQLKMEKRVPVGAGMGGGSSDAAAMLLALRDLYALDLDDAALREVAMTLGSDIAYFIDSDAMPRPAIVEGFGDRIERVEPSGRSRWLTMLFPPFGCDTAAVYRAFDDLSGHDHELLDDEVRALATGGGGDIDGVALFNDLARAACAVQPRLGELRAEAARSADSPVHVTGSGSALFIVPRDADHAEWLAVRLRDDLSIPARSVRVFV